MYRLELSPEVFLTRDMDFDGLLSRKWPGSDVLTICEVYAHMKECYIFNCVRPFFAVRSLDYAYE